MTQPLSTTIKRVGIFLATVVVGPVAYAQSAESGSGFLEEIVVTAQKRSESIQDVPITVAAVSGSELRDRNISDPQDLASIIPNTSFTDTSGGGVPVVIIRGVGLQNFRVNDTPTTSFYIDEIYQVSVAQASFTMFDLARIEALKGPQGGLYGRNAVAGAIQVISEKPSLDETSGFVNVGYGSYGRFSGEAAMGGPVSDNLAVRVAGRVVKSDDSYFRSVTGDFDHGEEDKWALRGQALFAPSDSTEFLFKVHGGEDTSETALLRGVGAYQRFGLNLVPNFADGALFNIAGVNPSIDNICPQIIAGQSGDSCETVDGKTPQEQGVFDIHDSASDQRNQLDNSWFGSSLIVTHDLSDSMTLTSVTGYDELSHGRIIDFDATASVQQHIDYRSDIEAWSQEFRLNFSGDAYNILLGATYAEDTLEEDTVFMGTDGLLPLAFGGLTTSAQPYTQETDMVSIFGQADFDLNDRLGLVIELRYTDETKSFTGGTFLTEVGSFLAFVDDETSFDAVSGKIGLNYALNDTTMIFANVSEGFKSGGYFGGFATDNSQLQPYDKETITAFEAGFKSDLSDRARLNGAVFYYDRSDVQASAADPNSIPSIARLTNIGDVETSGAELEGIFYLSDSFLISGGVGWVDSEISDSNLVVSDLYSVGRFSPEGSRLPNSPEFSANLVAAYERQLNNDWTGGLQLEFAYQSEQDLTEVVRSEEAGFVTEDSYSLVNLRLHVGNDDWRLGAFVENLFDEEYRIAAGDDGTGGLYEIYGAPTTWGVTVSKHF